MSEPRVKTIKQAQKERILYRALSSLLLPIIIEYPILREISFTRVGLSSDKSTCTLYFYTPEGSDFFSDEVFEVLKLYKPSMRKALAHLIHGRYTPDIRFKFDDKFEKQQRIEKLIHQVSQEDHD